MVRKQQDDQVPGIRVADTLGQVFGYLARRVLQCVAFSSLMVQGPCPRVRGRKTVIGAVAIHL